MATNVDISFVPALQDTIVSLMAEDPEMIRSTVRVRTITGKTDKWERLGGVELTNVTSRHNPTPHTPMTHSARLAIMADYAGSELLDTLDTAKMMVDPKNEYTQNLARAWRVRVARTIVNAIDGNAVSVDASEAIANGGTGFTMAKWRQANRILDNAGVPRQDRALLISASAIKDLMADAQVTSRDYSNLAAIQQGTRGRGAPSRGPRVIMISDAIPDENAVLTGGTITPVLPKTGNIRSNYLYHKSAVGLSFALERNVRVSERDDLSYSWQTYLETSLGAARAVQDRQLHRGDRPRARRGGVRQPHPRPGRDPDPRRRALLGADRGGHLRAHDRPGGGRPLLLRAAHRAGQHAVPEGHHARGPAAAVGVRLLEDPEARHDGRRVRRGLHVHLRHGHRADEPLQRRQRLFPGRGARRVHRGHQGGRGADQRQVHARAARGGAVTPDGEGAVLTGRVLATEARCAGSSFVTTPGPSRTV